MRERHVDEPEGRDENADPDDEAAADRREQVRKVELAVRERRQQYENDVARHLRLHQARRAVRERVLEDAHHGEPRNEESRVLDARVDGDATAQRVREDDEIEKRREHRRGDRLHLHLPEAQPLLVEERVEARHLRISPDLKERR